MSAATQGRFVRVDGVATHYLDAGSGTDCVVLLHGGDFGGAAELTWTATIDRLAPDYRVVAPDLLGYGRTDKLRDFVDQRARMKAHLVAFLEVHCIRRAALVGVSLGGRLALEIALGAGLDVWSVVAVSSAPPDRRSAAFRSMTAYDGTRASYRRALEVTMADQGLLDDPEFFESRYRMSRMPGAWECARAAGLRAPRDSSATADSVQPATASAPTTSSAGPLTQAPASAKAPFDTIAYDRLTVPVLFVQGAEDVLGDTTYAPTAASLVKDGTAKLLPGCGHSPQIEQPSALNELISGHLAHSRRTGPA